MIGITLTAEPVMYGYNIVSTYGGVIDYVEILFKQPLGVIIFSILYWLAIVVQTATVFGYTPSQIIKSYFILYMSALIGSIGYNVYEAYKDSGWDDDNTYLIFFMMTCVIATSQVFWLSNPPPKESQYVILV